MAAKKEKWISGAIKHRGGLHRSLGIPEDQPIPKAQIEKAAAKPGKIGKQARLAETLGRINKK